MPNNWLENSFSESAKLVYIKRDNYKSRGDQSQTSNNDDVSNSCHPSVVNSSRQFSERNGTNRTILKSNSPRTELGLQKVVGPQQVDSERETTLFQFKYPKRVSKSDLSSCRLSGIRSMSPNQRSHEKTKTPTQIQCKPKNVLPESRFQNQSVTSATQKLKRSAQRQGQETKEFDAKKQKCASDDLLFKAKSSGLTLSSSDEDMHASKSIEHECGETRKASHAYHGTRGMLSKARSPNQVSTSNMSRNYLGKKVHSSTEHEDKETSGSMKQLRAKAKFPTQVTLSVLPRSDRAREGNRNIENEREETRSSEHCRQVPSEAREKISSKFSSLTSNLSHDDRARKENKNIEDERDQTLRSEHCKYKHVHFETEETSSKTNFPTLPPTSNLSYDDRAQKGNKSNENEREERKGSEKCKQVHPEAEKMLFRTESRALAPASNLLAQNYGPREENRKIENKSEEAEAERYKHLHSETEKLLSKTKSATFTKDLSHHDNAFRTISEKNIKETGGFDHSRSEDMLSKIECPTQVSTPALSNHDVAQTLKRSNQHELQERKKSNELCSGSENILSTACVSSLMHASTSNMLNCDRKPNRSMEVHYQEKITCPSSAFLFFSNDSSMLPNRLGQDQCKQTNRNEAKKLNLTPTAQAPVQSEANRRVTRTSTKTRKFVVPQNWEKQKIQRLVNITRSDRNVSVFAVVKYFYPPKKTRGSDMSFHFGLVDPTLYQHDECLKCICFQEFLEDIPFIANNGDVIKFPLRISVFNNNLQGRTYDGPFPWMTFDGAPNSPIVPRYSRCLPAPTFSESDQSKVKELKTWAVSVGLVRLSLTLAELTNHEDLYFDLLCQVVHVDGGGNILHVWDGTEPSIKGLLSTNSSMFVNGTKWGRKVIGRCVKVWVFGNCELRSTYTSGQYIRVTNLHFKEGNDESGQATKIPVLTLYEGKPFERKIIILADDHHHVREMASRMKVLSSQDLNEDWVTDEECLSLKEVKLYDTDSEIIRAGNKQILSKDVAKVPGLHTTPCQVAPCKSGATGVVVESTKLLLDDISATVSVDQVTEKLRSHPDCPFHKIAEIKDAEKKNERLPEKFRCRAVVRYIFPQNVVQMVKYVCPSCKRRYKVDQIKDICHTDTDFNSREKCRNENCSTTLSLALLCSFIIDDNTDTLDVIVSDVNNLSPDVTLMKLLNDRSTQELVERSFIKLLEKKELIDFEIKIYTSSLHGTVVYLVQESVALCTKN